MVTGGSTVIASRPPCVLLEGSRARGRRRIAGTPGGRVAAHVESRGPEDPAEGPCLVGVVLDYGDERREGTALDLASWRHQV